jgi:hypothetical protein
MLALVLGSRGVAVVVGGSEERVLARLVGEVVAGGGRARHVAGKVGDSGLLLTAVEKAREVFGELTHAVMVPAEGLDLTMDLAVLGEQVKGARVLVVQRESVRSFPLPLPHPGSLPHDGLIELTTPTDDSAERIVDLALFLLLSDRRGHARTVRVG